MADSPSSLPSASNSPPATPVPRTHSPLPCPPSPSPSPSPTTTSMADLLARFASMLFPKYAPPLAEVVILCDPNAPLSLVLDQLLLPCLFGDQPIRHWQTIPLARDLWYFDVHAPAYHAVAFPSVLGFIKNKVITALQSANHIYYLLDSQPSDSMSLPNFMTPYLERTIFICLHSLVTPEFITKSTFTSLNLPSSTKLILLDGSNPDNALDTFINVWNSAQVMDRLRRRQQLLDMK